jgi:tRNA(fMet)-specific endonuclease VapC
VIWILDTDHLSLLERRNLQILNQIACRPSSSIAITVITAEEQLRGRLNVVRQVSQKLDDAQMAMAYSRLRQTLDDLRQFNVVDFTPAAIAIYKTLVAQKLRVGTQDLRIAAITLSLDATLVTRNHRDFDRVPNLKIEDWTI